MKIKFRCILFVFFIGNFVVGCKKTESKSGSDIQIIVQKTDGSPIPNATITINSENSINTDSKGISTFLNIQPQKYKISVSKQGFKTDTLTINLNADETRTINFTLIEFTPQLSISLTNLLTSNIADSAKLQISSNVHWAALSDSPTWLRCEPENGNENTKISIIRTANITKNERSGTITFLGEYDTKCTFSMSQASGASSELTVDMENYNVGTDAGTSYFTLNSNIAWTAASNTDRLSCTPTSGLNSKLIRFDWSQNTVAITNVGYITVTGEDGTTKIITITQDSWIPPIIDTLRDSQ